jgi:hypothetical protein
MRRALLIAYHFPPAGGAGVQRAVKLARYLPRHGWAVDVLTGPQPREQRWTPLDPTLTEELEGVRIHRTNGVEPPRGGRRERWLGSQGAWARWWADAVVDAGAGPAADADVILATMSPFESAPAADRLSRRSGTPWVADLRDPWALDEMTAYVTALHRGLEARRMGAALTPAAAVVMNTPESARRTRERFPELAPRVVEAIPNGFDSADFDVPAPERDHDALRIVHTGYLHTELERGNGAAARLRRALEGSAGRVDRGARSHLVLLEALHEVAAMRPERPIELHLAGVLSDADRAAIAGSFAVHDHG